VKKLLLIIFVGFVIISILAIMFTFQRVSTFTFEDDNGDNGDDNISISNLDDIENKLTIFPKVNKQFNVKINALKLKYNFTIFKIVNIKIPLLKRIKLDSRCYHPL